MRRFLDLEAWKRRQHFDFFLGFEQPFFNITAEVDVTALARACREPGGPSFFVASLWLSLKAANAVEELRYRLVWDEEVGGRAAGDGAGAQPKRRPRVEIHETVHGGSTVLRPDETFTFAYFRYTQDFPSFAAEAARRLEEARNGPGDLIPHSDGEDVIYYTALPWIAFTGFRHARMPVPGDSIPRIVFGKHHEDARGRRMMPVSLEVHHALADGLHAGRFFAGFQELLDGVAL